MRVKGGKTAMRRRKRIVKAAKGYRGARGNLLRSAKEAVMRGLKYAYRDRRQKKRSFRRLWIVRINAAAREEGLSYSQLMHGLKKGEIDIDRKVLADLAVHDPKGFAKVVEAAKALL